MARVTHQRHRDTHGDPTGPAASAQTMRRELDAYLTELCARDFSDRTVVTYRSKVRTFLNWLDAQGVSCDRAALIGFRDHLQREGRRPRTIRQTFVALDSFFTFLRAFRSCENLPDPDSIKKPRIDPPRRYVVTDEELAALFETASRLPRYTQAERFERARTQAVLAVLAYTGIRRGELISLDVADILGDECPWRLRVRHAKGGEYREVPLNDACCGRLQEWLVERAAWCERRQGVSPAVARALFPVDRNRRLGDLCLDNILRRLKHLAGLEDRPITPHCLRAWFITRAAASVDIVTASKLAGHASIDTTLQHYLKTDPSRMAQAVSALPALTAHPTSAQHSPSVANSEVQAPQPHDGRPSVTALTRHQPGTLRRGPLGPTRRG